MGFRNFENFTSRFLKNPKISLVFLIRPFLTRQNAHSKRYSSSEQIHTKWTDISEKKYSLRSIRNNDLKVPKKPKLKFLGLFVSKKYLGILVKRNIP